MEAIIILLLLGVSAYAGLLVISFICGSTELFKKDGFKHQPYIPSSLNYHETKDKGHRSITKQDCD